MDRGAFSGNSSQRRKAKRTESRIEENVTERVLQSISADTEAALSSKSGRTTQQKLAEFWKSSPLWAAVGILMAAVTAHLSLKILFCIGWLVLVGEFVRVGFFKERHGILWTILGNIAGALAIACCLLLLWRVVPKSNEPPTLDQQFDVLLQRFPYLRFPPNQPKEQTRPPTTHPSPSAAPSKPSPDTRGYLHSIPQSLSFESTNPISQITVNFLTENIGRLQILPKATIWAYVRFRHEMTASEEDALFNTWNLGGGPGSLTSTEQKYWDPGVRKVMSVAGHLEFETPSELPQEWDEFKRGDLLAYIYVRHIFQDRLGKVVTESCFIFKGPDFSQTYDCHGHSGPAQSPPIPKTLKTISGGL